MGIFGSHKSPKDLAAKSDIPEEIYQQVRVMGDVPSRAFSSAPESETAPASAAPAPAPKQPSPFLSETAPRPTVSESQSASGAASASSPAARPPQNLPLQGAPEAVPVRLAQEGSGSVLPEISSQSPRSHWRRYLVWGLSALLLLILVGGAAYFMLLRTEPVEMADSALLEEPEAPESPAMPEPLPFSVSGANYLPINTETSTSESIESEISAQEAKLQASGIEVPVKFLITDQNNIPIAFSRFAFLLGLPLESELVNLFEESFSLYLYNDGGTVRRALVLSVDTEQARFLDEQLRSLENQLPSAMKQVFYPAEGFRLDNPVFATGNFNGKPVRYVNFDLDRNFSFDYLKTETLLIFGNSKNMVRAVLSAEEGAK